MANTPANRKSPRKSAKKSTKLPITFTGKVRVVFELQDYGPMEIRADDMDIALALIKVLVSDDRCVMDVNSYNDEYAERLRALFSDG